MIEIELKIKDAIYYDGETEIEGILYADYELEFSRDTFDAYGPGGTLQTYSYPESIESAELLGALFIPNEDGLPEVSLTTEAEIEKHFGITQDELLLKLESEVAKRG